MDITLYNRDSGFDEIDFLLPHGLIIPLQCNGRDSLKDVKIQLWQKAQELPGFNLLRRSEYYGFIGVTPDAVAKDLCETTKIEDLRLAKPIIEVSDVCQADKELIEFYTIVRETTGLSVQILDQSRDQELQHVRSCIQRMCHPLVKKREQYTDEQRALFTYPPRLDKNEDLPVCTARKIMKCPAFKIPLNVWMKEIDTVQCYSVMVPAPDPPERVIEEVIACRDRQLGLPEGEIVERRKVAKETFVLKVRGRQEYMLQESCIHTYEYIRNCIDREEVAELEVTSKESLIKSIPDNSCWILKHVTDPVPPGPPVQTEGDVLSWDIPHDVKYCIRVRTRPSRCLSSNVYVQAQLFHGDQPLCPAINTLTSGFNVLWSFDVSIESLPRCARLCFITIEGRPTDIGLSSVKILNWANIQVFDHTKKLVTGNQTVRVNNFPKNCTKKEYPLGTPGSNMDDSALELVFDVVPPCEKAVYYPSTSYIDTILRRESNYQTLPKVVHEARLNLFELLDRIVHSDPLKKMSQFEKSFLWKNRHLAMNYQPNILPRIIQCVRWKERHDVFNLYELLRLWPFRELSLVTALQLIGPEYPDQRVRSLAVAALDSQLSDRALELILPQLVQALKLESYQHNELSRFLLCRALFNKNLGHRYFWHLRSEMYNGLSRLRFAPLLEAYCLYCGSDVLEDIQEEVKAITEYQRFTSTLSSRSSLEDIQRYLQDWLRTEEIQKISGNQTCIFDRSLELGEICPKDSKVMASKQKPLMISLKNCDEGASDKRCIIKNGDDLRQDMLVMQLIRIMDMILKSCCRDYWITTYECMSLDEDFGIIEVVEDAKTVCDIGMHNQTGVMTVTSMHEWLYTSTQGEKYLEAVKKFTLSCAAFCVITYILGIGDRHSDNIMLKRNGQLFHIDFGHFMNHKKEKLKMKRERTPFVMTKDFMRIVMKGDLRGDVTEKQEFQHFVYLCLEAFMTIRRHGPLLLTLLNLMMHCELPELQDSADIDYCRKCLALDKPDHEAANAFCQAFADSYRGQWMTRIDWFLHRVNRAWQGSIYSS